MNMMTNSSSTPNYDTLTIGGNKLLTYNMKLDGLNLPMQLGFNRKFYGDKIKSWRLLSYHKHKFRITIRYKLESLTCTTEVLGINGWSTILTNSDINSEIDSNQNKITCNEILNLIEERFIQLICLLY